MTSDDDDIRLDFPLSSEAWLDRRLILQVHNVKRKSLIINDGAKLERNIVIMVLFIARKT